MSTIAKVFGVLLLIGVIVGGGIGIAISSIDIDKYRPQIAEALTKQIGRTVMLGGPIHLAVSRHGIGLAVDDASIGNPAWASRPQMAGIGHLQIGVELMPLLSHEIVVSELDVSNADIQLETGPADQHNWEMKPAATPGIAGTPATKTAAAPAAAAQPMLPRVNSLSILNSQLAMRDKNGKMSTFKIEKMTLAPSDHGTAISVSADYNGTPLKLSFKSTSPDLIADVNWPYTVDLTFANYHLNTQGRVNMRGKSVELNPYELAVGDTSLHGQLMADFGGGKTQMHGSIMGTKLDPADFKSAEGGDAQAKPESAPATANEPAAAKPLFSTAPLNLSALKSIDASIDVDIGEIPVAKGSLKQVSGKLTVANGNLAVSPFKAALGDSMMQGDLKVEGTAPPQYSLAFKAPGVDIASLLEMLGTKAFMTGKGDADIQLSGAGASPHDMASNTNGHIDVTAENGTISASSAGGIASGLAQIFAPGNGNPTLNCMAVRFNVANGLAKDNGILADSSASTVAGTGGFSLRDETVDLTLQAKPKLVNTRGITPAVKISGPLLGPSVGIDASNVAQNVAGVLAKGSSNKIAGVLGGVLGAPDAGVPAIAAAPQGQNACIYTLDHKGAAAAAAPAGGTANTSVKDVAGSAATKAKDAGKQIMQGLFGH